MGDYNMSQFFFSFVLLTSDDVPRLGHNFKAISHFIHTVTMGQKDQFLLLKASDKNIHTHKWENRLVWYSLT